tara:strand:+ start:58 stop:339 length:282 start_codon:yes stop_codon:yes gene_type:complete
MGSLKRQLARKRAKKQKKLLEKGMKRISEQVSSAPKVCGECGAKFDNTDKDMLNKWRIAVYEDGRMHLTCPACGPTPEEIESSLSDERLKGDQ